LTPPEGTLLLRVYGRDLSGRPSAEAGAPSLDIMWLTTAEWQALAPGNARKGDRHDVPAAIAQRLFRFHLVDLTRGLAKRWASDELRSGQLTLTVEQTSDSATTLRLAGSVLLASDGDRARAESGYEARLLGYLHFDKKKQVFDRCDIVSRGELWGNRTIKMPPNRTGPVPFGFSFELGGQTPGERALRPGPGALWARWDWTSYLGKESNTIRQ
jgi:hypothetical protein